MTDRKSQQATSVGCEQNAGNLISHKSIVEIAEPHRAIRDSGVHVDSGQPMAAGLEVGIEVHPISAQSRQPIAVPKELREAIELMRRIQPIEQAILNVVRTSIS